MFHLMPYRDLPADFERRYNSAYIDPMWFDVADSDKVGQFYNATLDEMLYAAKAGLHGLCTNQHHQNVASPERLWLHGKSKHHGRGAREADQWPEYRNHPARLDAAFHHAADAHRGRIRDARLHQRRTAGRWISDGAARRRHHLERRHSGRAARAFSRSTGPGDQGLVCEGHFRLERQTLSARHGEPLAAADPAAPSADLDS